MNEWSPGGTFSRPVTPNQQHQIRSFRSPWEEQNIDKASSKPHLVNIRSVADTKSRATVQQRSQEDVSKTSLSVYGRQKKSVNGPSDPRFKRVINSGAQNDACVGTEMKLSRPAANAEPKDEPVVVKPEWNVTDLSIKQQWIESIQASKESSKTPYSVNSADLITAEANPESAREIAEREKVSSSGDMVPNTVTKQSLSDCTINTRNTSLVSEDIAEGYEDRLQPFSSTTRVKKVQNWIADQKPKLDKKQSVITVIGQTQGQSPLSSAFQEIDQRRKLVKELDKYAICNKITDSDKYNEINTLVAQINFLSPSGKVLHSADMKHNPKEMTCKMRSDIEKYLDRDGKCGKLLDLNYNDHIQCSNEFPAERDTSLSPSSREASGHSQKKLCASWGSNYNLKGKIRQFIAKIPYPCLAYFMIIISAALCWYTYLVFQRSAYFPFDLFPQKPKCTTWYEKICYWIWEIFRPYGKYHRSSTWSLR